MPRLWILITYIAIVGAPIVFFDPIFLALGGNFFRMFLVLIVFIHLCCFFMLYLLFYMPSALRSVREAQIATFVLVMPSVVAGHVFGSKLQLEVGSLFRLSLDYCDNGIATQVCSAFIFLCCIVMYFVYNRNYRQILMSPDRDRALFRPPIF